MNINLKPKPAKSLGHALRRGLVQAVMITAAFGASYYASGAGAAEQGDLPQAEAPTVQVDKAAVKAQRLLDTKCQPYAEGTIPGHAVVHLPGEKPAYVESGVGFDLWGPDEQFGTADDLPGTLYDFCR